MPRWGIVGTGDISSSIAADLLAVDPRCITGVWGRTPERAAEFAVRHSIPYSTHSRAELFVRDDLDIVYIATPAHTHLAVALEALDAGKHVLIEKPIATSAQDAAALFERAAVVGRFAMEAMWMRFNPLHVELRERIGSGELGRVSAVRASFGTPFRARGGKLSAVDGGNILLDRGIYPVTLAHWFLGEPDAVAASGALVDGVDIAGHATLDYAGGGFAQLAWSGTEFLDLSASVSGDRGWMTIDPMFWAGSSARVHAGSAERIFHEPELVQHPRRGNGYQPMLRAVADAVAGGAVRHPWHDETTTLAVMHTLDRIASHISSEPAEGAA